MDVVKQHYIIDFSSNNNFVQIPAMQGDGHSTRYAELELIENGKQLVLDPEEVEVSIIGTKPDTKAIWNDCTITEEGYIRVEITQQMTAVKGRGDYCIMINHIAENRQLKSFPFIVLTTAAPFDPDYFQSTDEFQKLIAALTNAKASELRAAESAESAAESAEIATNAKNEVVELANEIQTNYDGATEQAELARQYAEECQVAAEEASAAQQAKEDSEAYAIGTRNGVPVGEDDPAFENNSKYYAENIAQSASEGAFRGATASRDGAAGNVPTPRAGQQNCVLMGDGTWSNVLEELIQGFMNNYFEALLIDDDGSFLVDDDNNNIIGDWKLQIA